MEDRTTYKQLEPEERLLIASMKLQGSKLRAIAQVLERPASTVCRELRRNATAEGGHCAQSAMSQHASRRQAARPAAKLDLQRVPWSVVVTMLSWKWSPQQIAATLKRVLPNEP